MSLEHLFRKTRISMGFELTKKAQGCSAMLTGTQINKKKHTSVRFFFSQHCVLFFVCSHRFETHAASMIVNIDQSVNANGTSWPVEIYDHADHLHGHFFIFSMTH